MISYYNYQYPMDKNLCMDYVDNPTSNILIMTPPSQLLFYRLHAKLSCVHAGIKSSKVSCSCQWVGTNEQILFIPIQYTSQGC